MGHPAYHPFKEQKTGKLFSAIFTFQSFLRFTLEIKFDLTVQMDFLSYISE